MGVTFRAKLVVSILCVVMLIFGHLPQGKATVGVDSDNDGWTNLQENAFGTNPYLADTDNDGIADNEDPDPVTAVSLEIIESAPPKLDSPDIRNPIDVWPELIENANRTIYLETYYISDSMPDEVCNAIESAAGRGVQVRILVDSGMYNKNRSKIDRFDALPNIEARTLNVGALSGGWLHAKYFVVDGKTAIIGSNNWSRNSLMNNREIGVLVRSKAVGEALISIFERDWMESGGAPLTPEQPNDADNDGWPDENESLLGTDPNSADTDNDGIPDSRDPNPFVPLSSPTPNQDVKWLYLAETPPIHELDNPSIPNTENVLCQLMDSTTERIRAELYQYSTAGDYTVLDNALRAAAARGADVKILVDDKSYLGGSYPHPETLNSLNAVPNISVKIIDIVGAGSWSGCGWVHAKTLFVDGKRAYVGSANWFAPHMGHKITLGGWQPGPTRDIGLVFESPKVVAVLENIFTRDWTSEYAAPVTEAGEGVLWMLIIGAAGIVAIAGLSAVLYKRSRGKPKEARLELKGHKKWYLHQEGKRYGPINAELLQKWIAEGRVERNALIWCKGMKKWQKITEAKSFRQYFSQA